ncbi:Hypothetical protein PHPALM_3077 [Phytophthora palmivora]|uniref:Uncharacterized protein n=1 Tax=Phytophthora palmivora TaxID=4796 RepID=A0A2P4YNF1_9STRA|nr:Hypothetical protein PHPALM_3077 [Phytophthora palmivora]
MSGDNSDSASDFLASSDEESNSINQLLPRRIDVLDGSDYKFAYNYGEIANAIRIYQWQLHADCPKFLLLSKRLDETSRPQFALEQTAEHGKVSSVEFSRRGIHGLLFTEVEDILTGQNRENAEKSFLSNIQMTLIK